MAKGARSLGTAKELRQQRSAAALRANLAKRKEQARARAAAGKAASAGESKNRQR
jgi:hypothetical protein